MERGREGGKGESEGEGKEGERGYMKKMNITQTLVVRLLWS